MRNSKIKDKKYWKKYFGKNKDKIQYYQKKYRSLKQAKNTAGKLLGLIEYLLEEEHNKKK